MTSGLRSIVVLGCAACNGDPNSPLSKGAFWGVLVLGGVILTVLGGFVGLFVFWMRRAKALDAQLAAAKAEALAFSGNEVSVEESAVWREETPDADSDAPGASTLH